MYKTASRNANRRRLGNRWKYIKPEASSIARFDRMRHQEIADRVQPILTEQPPVFITCPICQSQIKASNLNRHTRKVHAKRPANRSSVKPTVNILHTMVPSAPPLEIGSHLVDDEFQGVRVNLFYVRCSKDRAIKAASELAKYGANINLIKVNASTSQDHIERLYFFPQAQGNEMTAHKMALALRPIGSLTVASFQLDEPPPVGYSVWLID